MNNVNLKLENLALANNQNKISLGGNIKITKTEIKLNI